MHDCAEKYERITKLLIEKKLMISTMESCTSGFIASLITDTEGASAIMKGAFVTYSNEAKIRQGVPAGVIEAYGVYSGETSAAMAETCRHFYGADYGVGVTGSFGNADPANADSVPGEVYFAIAAASGTWVYHCLIPPLPDRFAYKLYMADVISGPLMEMINA